MPAKLEPPPTHPMTTSGYSPGHLHLHQAFLADDRLVEHDVVEHAAEGVVRVVSRSRHFHRLADGQPQAARGLGIYGQHGAAGVGGVGRARHAGGPPYLHHALAVRFLPEGDPHHVDEALHPEHGGGHGESAAPLAGARLRGEFGAALHLVVVGLRHRRVGLVRACRTRALILVVDVGRSAEGLLPTLGPVQRGGPPQLEDLLHLFWDLDVLLHRHFLLDQFHREERCQVGRPGGLEGSGMEGRWTG